MAQQDLIMPVEAVHELPEVRTLSIADLHRAVVMGLDDFRAMPTHVIFLALIYPVVGLLMAAATFGYDVVPMLYPLASGFALIGPLAAIGLYELSRRREAGLDTSWSHAFDIVHSPSFRSIIILGLMLLAIFAIWIVIADAMYVSYLGDRGGITVGEFARALMNTREGLSLAIVGNLVGLVFAVLAFTLSVISFPLLLDRNVGASAAVVTSAQVVLKNPVVMAAWGLIVAGGLVAGTLLAFVGLAIVVPVLGHSTWHLYRMAVAPDTRARPVFRSRPKAKRYAADFPASLFAGSKVDDDSASKS